MHASDSEDTESVSCYTLKHVMIYTMLDKNLYVF